MWQPNLTERQGPIYRAVANALEADIRTGRLAPGARLPTQRALADHLGVTLGTATRAYAEAERRGLVESTVGRGTFVRQARTTSGFRFDADAFPVMGADIPGHAALAIERSETLERAGLIDLSANYPVEQNLGPALAPVLAEMGGDEPQRLNSVAVYQSANGRDAHRAAGAAWLARLGLAVDPANVVVIPGTQGGLTLALDALARPGDVVLTETLTWPGFAALARHRQLHVEAVAMDEHGLRPDALAAAARSTGARVVYCMPTLHNPTSVTMPEDRRRDILAVAATEGLTLIEDDVYGALQDDPLPPLAALDPTHAVYVTSLSKCVAPGLRIGYLTCPPRLLFAITESLRTTLLMACSITAEIGTRLIESGRIKDAAHQQREAAKRRQLVAARALPHDGVQTAANSFQLWLRLPEPWLSSAFVKEALTRGVGLSEGSVFTVDGHDPRAVRLSLCAAPDEAALAVALRKVADLLGTHPGSSHPIV